MIDWVVYYIFKDGQNARRLKVKNNGSVVQKQDWCSNASGKSAKALEFGS